MTIVFSPHTPELADELNARRVAPKRMRQPDLARQVEHAAGNGGVTRIDVERMQGSNDLVRINYLERGLLAGRAVCRIRIAAPFGDTTEYGTGFLVGPGLMLTNNHVIQSVQDAQDATAEFGFESDVQGRLRQARRFRLAPDQAFVTDAQLDYTLVAVEPVSDDGVTALADYGFLRLQPGLHKIEELQWVTVIQHPEGDEKYIAVRENQVIKIGDDRPEHDSFIWYRSDTARGSSGAPAFK